MKKILLISTILISLPVYSEVLYGSNYVSPETYAVNEADMYIDYSRIPAGPRLNVDNLDEMRFNAPNIVEKDVQIVEEPSIQAAEEKPQKHKKVSDDEAYKKKLTYKFAKWWVDQRYKREEAHHGSIHEIKVQKRLDYEQKMEERQNLSEQAL